MSGEELLNKLAQYAAKQEGKKDNEVDGEDLREKERRAGLLRDEK
jgi:hypothetical protein